jgi:hypothetical protein
MLKNKARDLEDGDIFMFNSGHYLELNRDNGHVVKITNGNDVRVRPLWDTEIEEVEPESMLITGDICISFIRSIDITNNSLRHR